MSDDRPADDPNHEQRRHPRVDLFRDISCEAGEVTVVSQVADLSVGGMFVDLYRAPFETGSPVRVRFSLRPDEPPLDVAAVVGYVQPGIGMGIRFTDLPEEDRARIAAFTEEASRRKSAGGPPLRKSARVAVELPVRVRGARPDGDAFEEDASLITLSKHGACLVSAQGVSVGMKLRLVTARGREFLGNVVWIGSDASRSAGQVGVQCRGLAQSLGFQFP
jgi:hypothetical protein